MKNYITFVLIIILTNIAYSNNELEDVIYLKNGKIFRGTIIEQVPNKSIKLKTYSNKVFVFNRAEIEKITKESKNTRYKSSGLKTGYKSIVNFAYQFGVGIIKANRIKLDYIYGFQLDPYTYFGFGIGVRSYTNYQKLKIPLFLNAKFMFYDSYISPFVTLGFGIAYDTYNSKEGFLYNPLIGMSFKGVSRTIIIGIGYENQIETIRDKEQIIDGEFAIKSQTEFGAIELFFGISF